MEGLRGLLESSGSACVVAAETSLEDALGAMTDLQPDLLLVDKTVGVRALAQLMHQSDFATAVIVWGTGISEPEALELLHAGVSGVVSKTSSLRELDDCVRVVASGRKWLDLFSRSELIH
jgi:DNA-binding NarL/FixJ family response regulator